MDKMLPGGITRDPFEVPGVHQRIAMDAHEGRTEFLLERLERILDEVFACLVLDGGVFLVGLEAQHFLDRDQLEAVAAAHADVRAAGFFARGAGHLLQLRTRETPGLAERGTQLLGADGFQQVRDGLGLEGLQGIFVERGDEDHRRWLGHRRKLACDFESVDAWHAHVQQHDVGRLLIADLERAPAVLGLGGHLESFDLRQHRTQQRACRRLVVDDEHTEAHARRTASTGWNGNRKVTMYSSSNRPAFTVERSPYMRSMRSLMFASARRLPSRMVRFAAGNGLRTTIVIMPLLNSPTTVTTPPSGRGSMP